MFYPNLIYISIIVSVMILYIALKIIQNKRAKEQAYKTAQFLDKALINFLSLAFGFSIGLVAFPFLLIIFKSILVSAGISLSIALTSFFILKRYPFILKFFLRGAY